MQPRIQFRGYLALIACSVYAIYRQKRPVNFESQVVLQYNKGYCDIKVVAGIVC